MTLKTLEEGRDRKILKPGVSSPWGMSTVAMQVLVYGLTVLHRCLHILLIVKQVSIGLFSTWMVDTKSVFRLKTVLYPVSAFLVV